MKDVKIKYQKRELISNYIEQKLCKILLESKFYKNVLTTISE